MVAPFETGHRALGGGRAHSLRRAGAPFGAGGRGEGASASGVPGSPPLFGAGACDSGASERVAVARSFGRGRVWWPKGAGTWAQERRVSAGGKRPESWAVAVREARAGSDL